MAKLLPEVELSVYLGRCKHPFCISLPPRRCVPGLCSQPSFPLHLYHIPSFYHPLSWLFLWLLCRWHTGIPAKALSKPWTWCGAFLQHHLPTWIPSSRSTIPLTRCAQHLVVPTPHSRRRQAALLCPVVPPWWIENTQDCMLSSLTPDTPKKCSRRNSHVTTKTKGGNILPAEDCVQATLRLSAHSLQQLNCSYSHDLLWLILLLSSNEDIAVDHTTAVHRRHTMT